MGLTEEQHIQNLHERISEIADQKWAAMDAVKKTSANNKLVAYKVKVSRSCLKRLETVFEILESWDDEPELQNIARVAKKDIQETLKSTR